MDFELLTLFCHVGDKVNTIEVPICLLTVFSKMPTSVEPPTRPNFDYANLDAVTAQFVQQQTGEIRSLMRRTAQEIIDLGQRLILVKEKLGHGRFGVWLASEFNWTDRTCA